MTVDQTAKESFLDAGTERVLKIHVGLTEPEVAHYQTMRRLLRSTEPGDVRARLIYDFRERFAAFVNPNNDWKSWGIAAYPKPPLLSIPLTHFMIIDRLEVSQPLMFRLNNSDAMSHKVYQAFDMYKAVIRSVGIPELVDDLVQWSTYLSLMQVVTSMKQFPRQGKLRELIVPMVMQGITALTEPRLAIISFALRTVRDSLDLPYARGRLILNEQGHVVTSPVN